LAVIVADKTSMDVIRGQGRIEEAVQRSDSDSILSATLESIQDGVLVVTGGRSVSHYNSRFCKMWSIPDEIMSVGDGKMLTKIVSPQLIEPELFISNIIRSYPSSKARQEILYLKDGRIFEQFSYPLAEDYKKRGRVWFYRDITDRKNLEEMLHLTRFCFNRASYGIWRTNREAKILDVNDYACHYTGYSREELLNMRMPDIDPTITPEIWKHLWQCMQTQGSNTIESIHLRKDGTTIPVEVTANYAEFEGREYAISIVKDISARKQAEKEKAVLEAQLLQAQKMEAVGQLAGGIAHDFNNLLQTILGNIQLLLIDRDKKRPDYNGLKQIEKASLKAGDLTRQLLTYSRKIDSQLKRTNLNQEVEQVAAILERTLSKMIQIELYLDEILCEINADPCQIEQILMNLAINAQHAMPTGGKLIIETTHAVIDHEYCKTHLGAKVGKYVVLSVSDSGTGMEKETIDRIYEPFYTTKKVGEGSGLGLSMVYGIIKNHGGYITCYSEPGKGTCFKIYFPAFNFEGEAAIKDKSIERIQGGSETILIVDDERTILDYAEEMLNKFGYKTLTATTGEEALAVYAAQMNRIELIILDLNMPGMGGRSSLEELIKIDPQVKVIVASGGSPDGNIRRTLEAGVGSFIGKPFVLQEMLNKIREILDSE
jgi:two-component system cell cycle sensor histidine kinase/response regulator CckA